MCAQLVKVVLCIYIYISYVYITVWTDVRINIYAHTCMKYDMIQSFDYVHYMPCRDVSETKDVLVVFVGWTCDFRSAFRNFTLALLSKSWSNTPLNRQVVHSMRTLREIFQYILKKWNYSNINYIMLICFLWFFCCFLKFLWPTFSNWFARPLAKWIGLLW